MIGKVATRVFPRPFRGPFFLAFLACLIAGAPVNASVVIDTNVAGVAVSDQSRKMQNAAVKEAFERVLVKMSGRRDISDNAEIKRLTRNPERYLLSYQYEARSDSLYYVAEFDEQALLQLLREQGLPVWGNRRPDTIMWLAKEENRQRFIVDEAHLSDIRQTVLNAASQRGISVSLPLMDLTDNQSISVYDVWGRFARSLLEASERYGVDYVIGARLYRNDRNNASLFSEQYDRAQATEESSEGATQHSEEGRGTTVSPPSDDTATQGEYALDWVFIGKDDTQAGTIYGTSEQQVTQQLIDDYADYLGKLFAVQLNEEDPQQTLVRISVANLNSLSRYVHAQRYLESLSVVGQARLIKQTQSVGEFEIALMGSVKDFTNTLALESRLQPVRDAFDQPLEGLNFYWNENE